AGAGSAAGRGDDGLAGWRPTERRGRTDELSEQRMRMRRPGTELGVELARDEEGVVGKLDDLHETHVLRVARDHDAAALERLLMDRVDLPPVTVPLVDDGLSVRGGGAGARDEVARLRAETHRGAHVGDVLLLGEQVDHGMRRRRIEL